MIKVSVLYPNKEGKKFDLDYYCDKHIPMAEQALGAALKGVAVEVGLSGPAPGSPPPYVVMAHLLFESVEAFQKAHGPHAETFHKDVPNYTDIEPLLQISEVRISR